MDVIHHTSALRVAQLVALVPSSAGAIILIAREASLIRPSVGCRAYYHLRSRKASVDAVTIDCTTIIITTLLFPTRRLILPCSRIDIQMIRVRKWRYVARSKRLVRSRFDYTLPCVLAFLRKRSLEVTSCEGIRSNIRCLFDSVKGVTAGADDVL